MTNFKLSPPWQILYTEYKILFRQDKDVALVFDDKDGQSKKIRLFVTGRDKAAALEELLPDRYSFGNVQVLVEVVPANLGAKSRSTLFNEAFAGNPAFSFSKEADVPGAPPFTYVVFRNKVIQYFADNLRDIYGNFSMLYENVAADVFPREAGTSYCTDLPDNLAAGADGGKAEDKAPADEEDAAE